MATQQDVKNIITTLVDIWETTFVIYPTDDVAHLASSVERMAADRPSLPGGALLNALRSWLVPVLRTATVEVRLSLSQSVFARGVRDACHDSTKTPFVGGEGRACRRS